MNASFKWVLGVIALVVFVSLNVGIKGKPAGDSVIKIGVIAPLNGGASVFGNSLVNGIRLAQEDLSDTKHHYELVVEDDSGNPATSASAAQKLVNVDKVKALITVTSGTGNAAKPIALGAKIVHVCVCADTTIGDGITTFNNLVLPNDETAGWIKEAKKRNVKRLAVISQQQPGINMIVDALESKLAEAGITLTYKDRLEPTIRDFRTSLGKARATNPDTYFILFFPPQLDILGQELAELKIENVSSTGGFPLSATPTPFEGKWFTDAALTEPAFMTRFEEEFPDTRFNVRTAPQGYDSYTMLVLGFEDGDAATFISKMTSFNGKSGHLTKAAGEGAFHAPVGLFTIKNEKPTLLSQ